MGDQNRFEEWQLFFLFISQRRMEKGMRIIIQYRIFPTDPRATFRLFRCVAIIHARSSSQIHVRFGKSVCVCSDLGKQRTKRENQKELNPKSRDKKCFYFLFFFSLFFLFIFSFFFLPFFFFSSLRHSIKRTSAVVKLTLAFQLLQFSIVIISGSRHEKSGLCSPFVHDQAVLGKKLYRYVK